MRTQRILVSLMTFALIGLVPIGFVASSSAASASVSTSAASAAAKPKRDISATNKSRNRKVIIKGKVKPGSRTKVVIQRRPQNAKKWRGYRTIRTNGQGNYSFEAPGGPKINQTQCYRIVVPGNGKFRKSYQTKITYGTAKGLPICITKSRV
ncbi:hypothetical protein GCM10027020_26610 [Nocardioides salsibiostraticola]